MESLNDHNIVARAGIETREVIATIHFVQVDTPHIMRQILQPILILRHQNEPVRSMPIRRFC